MGEEKFGGLGSPEFLDGDALFGNPEEVEEKKNPDNTASPEGNEDGQKENNTTEEIDPDSLFGEEDDNPESVGGEGENNKDGQEADTKGESASPEGYNPYSSFAKALKGDGLFQFLDDDKVDSIENADSFSEAFEEEINARLDAETRRVKEALDAQVPVDRIKQFEGVIKQLDSFTEEMLTAETEQGRTLRQNILMQDYLNRGFSKERAQREVKRIVESGSDVEDAKDALESNKEFFKSEYQKLVDEGKAQVESERKKVKSEAEAFKKAILEQKDIFGDVEIDKATRQTAYEAMTRIVDNNEGDARTIVQKYADENPASFRAILGLTWALTDGFTKMGNLLSKHVDKKVRSNLKEIETKIQGSRSRGGSLNYIEGDRNQGSSSPFSKGWRLGD